MVAKGSGAQRLFGMRPDVCERVFAALMEEGTLRCGPDAPMASQRIRVSRPSARWDKSQNRYRVVRPRDRAAIRAGTFGRNTTRNSVCRDEGPHPVNGTPGTGSCVCVPGQQHRWSLENPAFLSFTPSRTSIVRTRHLCVKGRYAFGFVSAADRVTAPMIREGRD